MATEPKINVYEQAPVPITIPDNIASSIAVIGAFNSTVSNLTIVNDVRTAHQQFGTMETEGNFKGTDAIDGLFKGASSLFVCNITTWSDDETPVASTTLTTEKLEAALAKLHNERFDMLFIAEQLTDAQQVIVTAWLDSEFENKYCHGQVAQLQKGTAAAYETSVALFNNNVYYINTQQFIINGETLSLNRSTAFMAGLIASLSVDTSLTSQTITGVTAVTPEYSTATGEMGATLLGLNVPFLKCRNRRLQEFYCVNSMLPDGYDLYINRTRDAILNHIAVEPALGQKNNNQNENSIITVMEGLKQKYINDLKLLSDITYHIESNTTDTKCRNLVIDSMLFEDILTNINIYYSIEVQ